MLIVWPMLSVHCVALHRGLVDHGLIHRCTRGKNAVGRPCIYHDDEVHSVCCELMTHYVPW